jgi:ATP-dependent RNA helicase RhlE
MPFSTYGLEPSLLRSLQSQGFAAPSPVQDRAIPPALQGQDVLAIAPTGSGKTLAYGLPLLHALCARSSRSGPSAHLARTTALVLVPTRELASQVGEALRALANRLPHSIQIHMVFGGVSINPQMQRLARTGADIVVATPGRLLDLLAYKALRLDALQTLVLDEADRLLDLGFAQELQLILAQCPARRQHLFFSATFAPKLQALAQSLLHEPVLIDLRAAHPAHAPDQTDQGQPLDLKAREANETIYAQLSAGNVAPADTASIVQRAIAVDEHRRTEILRELLVSEAWPRVLVFVASQHAAERVAMKLRKVLPSGLPRCARVNAEPFHAGLSQGKRTQVLADFKNSRLRVVVATDVAARGLDIVDLPVVVNYDLPRASSDYTHRMGRTGRAGASGLAVSLVTSPMQAHWRLIDKRLNLKLELETLPGFEPTDWDRHDAVDETTPTGDASSDSGQPDQALAFSRQDLGARQGLDPNGGVKGRRPSKKDKLRAQGSA